jgi:hypothetical protein
MSKLLTKLKVYEVICTKAVLEKQPKPQVQARSWPIWEIKNEKN